jgi:crotonobetaine/carnitine-CoA ligase
VSSVPFEGVHPFAGWDLPWLLAARAQAIPHKTLLTWAPFDMPAQTYSYAHFHELVGCVAAGLQARGVRSGSRVLVHLDNCPEFLLSWCALAELGAVAVTTHTRSTVAELNYFITHAECMGAITQPSCLATVQGAGAHLSWVICTEHDAGVTDLAHALPASADRFAALLAQAAQGPRRQMPADPLRPLCVQYTSGTTSRPKGVLMTHGNALWGARVSAAHEQLVHSDVHLVYAPLFHVNALAYSFLPALWAGASVVLQPRFSSSRFWSVASTHGATWASMIPFALRALSAVERPAQHAFRCWGSGMAGSPIANELGIPQMGWYGMTETITQPISGEPALPNRAGSMGRAAPEYGVRIVNAQGEPVARGDRGLLEIRGVRGLSLFAGYLNDAPATRQAFTDDGWFITGDEAVQHEDGALDFAGRSKDMLKVGGENVSPLEVEQVIAGVAMVAEVAVVARPHALLGEVGVAFVRPGEGLSPAEQQRLVASIQDRCAATLADFKRPREVILVADFPRATLNKIAKAQLRARLNGADEWRQQP